VFLGWLILDEQITVTTAVGAAVVVASVWWIVRARPVAPAREATAEARPVPETEARSVL
jgi:drug/metabolite transporter (DMT)-like permease